MSKKSQKIDLKKYLKRKPKMQVKRMGFVSHE